MSGRLNTPRLVSATLKQLRAGLRVLEKHFVEIAEAEEQQRVSGQFTLDAAVLCHHRSELSVAAHPATLAKKKNRVERKFRRRAPEYFETKNWPDDLFFVKSSGTKTRHERDHDFGMNFLATAFNLKRERR